MEKLFLVQLIISAVVLIFVRLVMFLLDIYDLFKSKYKSKKER